MKDVSTLAVDVAVCLDGDVKDDNVGILYIDVVLCFDVKVEDVCTVAEDVAL